jgi:hypothetical protein
VREIERVVDVRQSPATLSALITVLPSREPRGPKYETRIRKVISRVIGRSRLARATLGHNALIHQS